jgi:hypothetical protein
MKTLFIRSQEAIKKYRSNRMRSFQLKEEGISLNIEKTADEKDLFKEAEIFRQRMMDRFKAKFKIEITIF